MTRRARHVAVIVASLLVWASVPAAGAGDKWQRAVRKLDSQLERSDWKKTLDRCQKQRDKMIDHFADPGVTLQLAAQTLLIQAVAEANLGRDAAALWHWHSAQNYLEGLPAMDLSGMGRAASILGGLSLDDVPVVPIVEEPNDNSRRREVKIKQPVRPTYPKALVKSGVEGSVVVKIIVGTDGRPHQPVILGAGLEPLMAFPALEALRDWRFTPAQQDEEPTAVYYELKINYP